MRIKKVFSYFSLALLLCAALFPRQARSEFKIDFELGPVFITKNDVRIPNSSGTLFSLTDDLKTDTSVYFRGKLIYTIGKRHNLTFLVAPFRAQSKGSLSRDLSFNGLDYPANTQLSARYRFDSYRFTYRYDIVSNQKIIFGLGLSAKIRAASISLGGSGNYTEYDNVGFVPLINLKLSYRFYKKLSFLIEGEGLGSPQGRAEDFLFAFVYDPFKNFEIRLGYRFLEGGADVKDVYNFAFINYISLGAGFTF